MSDYPCPVDGCSKAFGTNHGKNTHLTMSHGKGATREELISDLQEGAEELGRTPTRDEFGQFSEWSVGTLKNRFDSYNAAVKEAGLEPNKYTGGKIAVTCDQCGDEFADYHYKISRYEHNFCSDDCYGEYRSENLRGEALWNYKGGSADNYEGDWWPRRQQVIERDGDTCQRCGITSEEYQERSKIALDVHHLRPYDEFDEPSNAHTFDNLVVVCRRCHKKLERLPIKQQLEEIGGRPEPPARV